MSVTGVKHVQENCTKNLIGRLCLKVSGTSTETCTK